MALLRATVSNKSGRFLGDVIFILPKHTAAELVACGSLRLGALQEVGHYLVTAHCTSVQGPDRQHVLMVR